MEGGIGIRPPARYGAPRFQNQYSKPGGFNPRFRGHGHKDEDGGLMSFDGKRMRNKSMLRKTVDYNAACISYLGNRLWQRDFRDRPHLQPDELYVHTVMPPPAMVDSPMNCVTTRFVRNSVNKIRCPIFCVCWTPEGRRLITGASSGEFTLWNGLTFNFETILQAHDTSVRCMVWSHNDNWMLTADHGGFVKYWQSNMNNVKMYQAHKEAIRGLSFCPTDSKYASCSDDGTVRIWDFIRCHEEKILRGHGADVKCVDWHPQKSLVASGSKDTQQPLKLWDPRMGSSLATIHAHKHTVMEVSWNRNGNWLLTASRDHLLKLFDVRNMKEEVQSFKGHKKEATTVAWHPVHESMFVSGGSDGAILFWNVGTEKEVGSIDEAHETMVWSLAWHPLGHILVSGSNDHSTKFWTRNRPGDAMRDKYNLNTLPLGMSEDMLEFESGSLSASTIPGMGLFQEGTMNARKIEEPKPEPKPSIPGLDFEATPNNQQANERFQMRKKIPYAKPVPKAFERAWSGGAQPPGFKQGEKPAEKQPAPEIPPMLNIPGLSDFPSMPGSGLPFPLNIANIAGLLPPELLNLAAQSGGPGDQQGPGSGSDRAKSESGDKNNPRDKQRSHQQGEKNRQGPPNKQGRQNQQGPMQQGPNQKGPHGPPGFQGPQDQQRFPNFQGQPNQQGPQFQNQGQPRFQGPPNQQALTQGGPPPKKQGLLGDSPGGPKPLQMPENKGKRPPLMPDPVDAENTGPSSGPNMGPRGQNMESPFVQNLNIGGPHGQVNMGPPQNFGQGPPNMDNNSRRNMDQNQGNERQSPMRKGPGHRGTGGYGSQDMEQFPRDNSPNKPRNQQSQESYNDIDEENEDDDSYEEYPSRNRGRGRGRGRGRPDQNSRNGAGWGNSKQSDDYGRFGERKNSPMSQDSQKRPRDNSPAGWSASDNEDSTQSKFTRRGGNRGMGRVDRGSKIDRGGHDSEGGSRGGSRMGGRGGREESRGGRGGRGGGFRGRGDSGFRARGGQRGRGGVRGSRGR